MKQLHTAATALAVVALAVPAVAVAHTQSGSGDMHGQTTPARPGTKMSIKVVKDPISGWNLLVRTRRFRFAPENASEAHRRGQGHAHLEIDGKPITRLYSSGYFISKLKPGRHRIRVALATNSHSEYVNGKGKALADTTTVRVPKSTGQGHSHGDHHGMQTRARAGTRVSIKVRKDRFSGWNLLIGTRRFRFAPENASESHRRGQGHAHLEIDGKPVTRVYGRGFFIPKLKRGRHRIRVALATNSHAEYVNRNGKALADTAIVRVR